MSKKLQTTSLPVEKLQLGKYQPRIAIDEQADDFKQLVASIKDKGVMTPLLVVPGEEEGAYDVLAGERRLRAAQVVGLAEVPVRELPDLDDAGKAEVALVDNLIRSDLSAFEVALALKALVDDRGITQETLAEHLGTTPTKIAKQMSILKAPDWLQEFVKVHNVGYSVADLFVRLERKYGEKKTRKLAARYRDKELGKRDLEKALSKVRGKTPDQVAGESDSRKDPAQRYARMLERDEKKGSVKMKAIGFRRSKPPTPEQAEQIVEQLEQMIAFVKEIAAPVESSK